MLQINNLNCYTINEACKILKRSRDTLASWRCKRNKGHDVGPKFIKFGQDVYYPDTELDAYLNRLVKFSN